MKSEIPNKQKLESQHGRCHRHRIFALNNQTLLSLSSLYIIWFASFLFRLFLVVIIVRSFIFPYILPPSLKLAVSFSFSRSELEISKGYKKVRERSPAHTAIIHFSFQLSSLSLSLLPALPAPSSHTHLSFSPHHLHHYTQRSISANSSGTSRY